VKTDWSVDADVLMSERLFKTSSAESDVSKMIVVMRSACSQIVAWMGLSLRAAAQGQFGSGRTAL